MVTFTSRHRSPASPAPRSTTPSPSQTQAKNFLDHNNIGESSIFIPITVQGALIQAWKVTLRSPHLWRYGQAHLAYSNRRCHGRAAAPG